MPFEAPRAERKRTPHTTYRLRPRRGQTVGDRVPSVTQVLRTLGNDALLKWANRQGLQGIDIDRDKSALDIGTLAHAGIQWWLAQGDKPDVGDFDPDHVEVARAAVRNWLRWRDEHEIEPILIESPLVHQSMKYGGTPDLLAKVDGVVELLDWKSGADPVPYPSHFVQLAAYRELLKANEHPIPERLRVVAFSRNEGHEPPYRDQVVTDHEPYFEVFRAALDAYTSRLVIGWR